MTDQHERDNTIEEETEKMRIIISILLVILLLTGISTVAFAEDSADIFGEVSGRNYSNTFFGFQFEGTSEWYLLDAEETAQVMGYALDAVFSDTELAEQLSESGAVYDFMAIKLDGSGDSVNVVLQDAGVLYGAILKIDVVLNLIKAQLEQTLADAGYQDVSIKQESVVFAGEERPSFFIKGTLSGIRLYEQAILLQQGQYLSVVTLASTKKDGLSDELKLFQPADLKEAEIDEQTAAVLDDAMLLINQGEGLKAKEMLKDAFQTSGDPVLETAIQHLENSQWKKVRQTVYKSDGSVQYDYSYEYDEAGRCIETRTLSADGSNQSVQITEYDQAGLKCGTTVCDADGKVTSKSVIICDGKGNPIRSEGSMTFEYFWNSFGDNTMIIRYNSDGEETSRTLYTYDEFGINTGMTNIIDGKSMEFSYDNKYDFDENEESLHVTSYHKGTEKKAVEYDFVFIPLK